MKFTFHGLQTAELVGQAASTATTTTSTMDKMKKLLSSPITRKKVVPNANRYFGIHLEELARKESEPDGIPVLIKKICNFIINNGKSIYNHGSL